MQKRFWKQWLMLLAVIPIIVLMSGCGQTQKQTGNAKHNQIKITATTDFYGEVAKSVVGKYGHVTSIIDNANVDPHDYEPTSNNALSVAKSQVLISNGLGYDSWMNRLANNNKSTEYVKVGEQVMHKHDGDNPHIWYNPKTMPRLANHLANIYSQKQPEHRQYFKQNAQKYIDSLKPIQNKISQLQSLAKKTKQKQVYVSEPVFDYALQAMNYQIGNQKFENDIEKSVDPSPAVIHNMQKGIKNRQIKFFVENKQVKDNTVTNLVKLCHQHQVPVLAVTETEPNNQNYVEWMDSQYTQLIKILKAKQA